MDWDMAIARNSAILLRILDALCVILGIGDGEIVATAPRGLRNHVRRIARAAESAVRRLVIIAARDVVVVVKPPRDDDATTSVTTTATTSAGSTLSPRGRDSETARMSPATPGFAPFPILDPLADPTLVRPRYARSFPRITFIGLSEPAPLPGRFLQMPDDPVDAAALCRRLHAIRAALGDLPRHARRLARWKARRDRGLLRKPRFPPLRPGRPPGHRATPRHEVDEILAECQTLALWAQADTS